MDIPDLSGVSETLFLPLYALSLESRSPNPIIVDNEAVAVTNRLDAEFRHSPVKFYRRLAHGRLPRTMVTTVSLRIRRFDAYVRAFLEREPDAVIVNMGCGLETRRRRVDNGRLQWFDLDFPDVIKLHEQLFGTDARHHTIASSVLDLAWLDRLPQVAGRRVLFLAEGLFMYLPPDGVRALVVALRERFPGAELVAELTQERIVRMMHGPLGRSKFRRSFGLSKNVVFSFGVRDSPVLESWAPGITLLDTWTYFDDREPKLWWMRPFARIPLVRKSQWTAHYRLGNP